MNSLLEAEGRREYKVSRDQGIFTQPFSMILILSKPLRNLKNRLTGLFAIALLEFMIGGFIGAVAVALFTEPLHWLELLVIPAGALGWWLLAYSYRQLFSKEPRDPDDLNPIAMGGLLGWCAFLILGASLVGGFVVAGMTMLDNHRLHQQARQTNTGGTVKIEHEFQVRQIIYAPPKSSAVINEQTVLVGDRIGKFRVTDIRQRSVIIQDDNGQTNLLMLVR